MPCPFRAKETEPSAVVIARARHFLRTARAWQGTHEATVCNGSYEAYVTYDANREFHET